MADPDTTPAEPMRDADTTPPPADADFQPAAPLKDAGVEFEATTTTAATQTSVPPRPEPAGDLRQQLTTGAERLQGQAGDKVREFADMGKQRAAGALDQLATMLSDAADQVDGKLGQQYGGYARNAAGAVQGFSQQVKEQDFDQLLDQGRELVRKSPAVAIGAAAAVGFVLSRLVQSGIDAERA